MAELRDQSSTPHLTNGRQFILWKVHAPDHAGSREKNPLLSRLAGQGRRLDEITGIGRLTAVMVLATLPELGACRDELAARPSPTGFNQRPKLSETLAGLMVNQFEVFLMVNGGLLTMPTMTDEKR